ncbi:hypothetical protein GF362_00760 [Candidatus Dojkabacteria bacterium]|nr:hypothetical protein [Candidatus Dojkabacteria bacterium]
MKIWFGCTTYEWMQNREYYFLIRDYLVELGCVILWDWIDEVDKRIKKGNQKRNIKKIYKSIIKAINEADASVIEYTVPNFSSSHQINYSVLRRKPTLVMRRRRDNILYDDSYLDALSSSHLTIEDYSRDNFKKKIQSFIGYSKIESGTGRYNFVLDKRQKYYLDWASSIYNKSRSEILRKLIEKEMKQDKKYKHYLQS